MTATRERAATMPGVDVSAFQTLPRVGIAGRVYTDRKSTRLNSSHGYISYAVFCLKKKKRHRDVWWSFNRNAGFALGCRAAQRVDEPAEAIHATRDCASDSHRSLVFRDRRTNAPEE